MAFPTIPTAASGDLLSLSTTTASTTHTIPNLSSLRGGAGPQAGDLLIAICVQYQGGTAGAEFSAWGAGFTELVDRSNGNTTDMAIGISTKIATGSESGTFTVTSAHSFMSVNFLMRIPAATWHGTTLPEVSTMVVSAGGSANPSALSPSWGAADILWIAVGGDGETSTTGSPPVIQNSPTNYSGDLIVARNADAVGNVTAGVGFYQNNAATEDAVTWTITNANRGRNAVLTIAVRPSATVNQTVTGVAASVTVAGGVGSVTAIETSPALELSGYTISGPSSGDTINSVTVTARHSETIAPTLQLWDGTTAQIGTDQTGTVSASLHDDSFVFTGLVTYSQLATLRVRFIGHEPSGSATNLDSIGIVVNYTAGTSPDGIVTGAGASVSVAGGIGSVNTSATSAIVNKAPTLPPRKIEFVSPHVISGPVAVIAGNGTVTGVGASVTVAGGIGSVKSDGKVAGVGASITVAGGTGSATTGTSGIVTGVPASIAVAGGIGSVTATSNATITGVGAQVVVTGGIGSLTTTSNATITGVGASITVAGGVGSASTGSSGIVTGVAAPVTVSGGIGSLSTSVTIAGVGASIPVTGGIGSVTPTSNAGITGVAAAITVAGGVGAAVSGGAGVVLGQAASVNVSGGIGSISTSAIIAGVAASISVDGGIGSVSTSVKITGVAASIAVDGGIGAAFAGGAGQVLGQAASVNVGGGIGAVSASAKITGIAAAIMVAGGVGSSTATTNVSVTGVAAQAIVAGGVGTVFAGGAGTVSGVAAHVTIAGGIGSVNATSPNAAVTGTAAVVRVFGGIGGNKYGFVISGTPASVPVGAGIGNAKGSAKVEGISAPVVVTAPSGILHSSAKIAGISAAVSVAGGIGIPSALAAKYFGHSTISGNANDGLSIVSGTNGDSTTTLTQPYSSAETGSI